MVGRGARDSARPGHGPVAGRYGDPVTSGAVRDAGRSEGTQVVSVGRPPWWAMALAVLVGAAVTANLLSRGFLERIDLRVSEIVSSWDLAHSGAYPLVWLVTQLGGRVTILVVLAALAGYLGWRRHAWLPLGRILLALGLLTVAVYGVKSGVGRTAPSYPGSFFFHADGASFPSGHVANAVLMWGVARWQAVEYGLPARVQRIFWLLSVLGPAAAGLAMISLDYHWVSDAIAGAAVGVFLLGVVHALNAPILSRLVRVRAGRQAT